MTTFHPHRSGFDLTRSHIHVGPTGEAAVIEDAAKLWVELMAGGTTPRTPAGWPAAAG